MTHKKEKKAEISYFKLLDVLVGGLAVAWKPFASSQRYKNKIFAFLLLRKCCIFSIWMFFFSFWSSKT
jgi:hypothetical protein